MAEQHVFTPKTAVAKPPADLSAEISARIEKQSDERVTCRRIWGDHYRCNWWAALPTQKYDNPLMEGLMVTTHRVRKSRFLNVTKAGENLVIEDCSSIDRREQ